MKDKSQIEEMRAAIRGDLERSRARREAPPAEPVVEETVPQVVEEERRSGLFSSLFKRRD